MKNDTSSQDNALKKKDPRFRFNAFDLILSVLILFGAGGFILHDLIRLPGGPHVEKTADIYIDGGLFAHYPLNVPATITLPDIDMIIEVEEGRIRVKHSDCPRKICERAGWIDKPGEIIACVPNRVLIEIKSEEEPFLDAVVQ